MKHLSWSRVVFAAWLAVVAHLGCSEIPAGNPYDPASSVEDQAKGVVSGSLTLPVGYDA
jgi:hypothetical protein